MKEMTTREVQMVCLDILKDVHEFCVKNNIRYSLSGGTLLGAIRHNGFIPWDDDADIQMPRPDYDRFIRAYQSEKGYKLFSCEVDGYDKTRLRLGRICEMAHTFVDNGPMQWTEIPHGVGIDIEPCDGAPNTEAEARMHLEELKRMGRKYMVERASYVSWKEFCRFKGLKKKSKFLIRKFMGLFIRNGVWLEKLVACQKKYDYSTSKYFMASTHYGMGEWQPKSIMESFELHKFENESFFIMSKYDDNLKSLFGADYMELPPLSKRITHSHMRIYWKE